MSGSLRELTFRGIVLGAILTVLFTAANVYLGLKIGITFATSIPAAVISMAVLKAFRDSNIRENNIVQTIASAAGTLSAIIFVLPGLIMVGWWTGFPYWLSVAVIGIGGILGVMYSVPLRRALVTGSDLPYPEGVAAAEVLKVGAGVGGAEENRRGLIAIIISSLVSAGYFTLAKMRLVAEAADKSFRFGAGATGVSASLSMALIGVGHLVGMAVGIAMIVGLVIARFALLPWLTAETGVPAGADVDAIVADVFRNQVRFIGAGTIGVAAIWTLLKILRPILKGIRDSIAASRARSAGLGLELTDRDLPITIVGGTILASIVPIAFLLNLFADSGPIAAAPGVTLGLSLLYILGAGVVIASVTGYMAGLIGASNSPVSGVGILSAIGISLILAGLFGQSNSEAATQSLVAFALFVTAIIFGIATISNDNLQDLKTGQLVGATPWRQQVALVIGVIFGAIVIPPILDLLNTAFGFQGAPGAGPNALAAPQAALISALAQGVLGGSIDWSLIGIGAAIGVAVIVVDEILRNRSARKYSLPSLAVGMGIYLPMDLTILIPIGALIGYLYNKWAARQSNPDFAERIGTLMATGLIVGESLMGVTYAAIVAGAERAGSEDSAAVLAIFGENPWAIPIGILLFSGSIAFLYSRTRREATQPVTA